MMSQNMSFAATLCVRHRPKGIGKGDLELPEQMRIEGVIRVLKTKPLCNAFTGQEFIFYSLLMSFEERRDILHGQKVQLDPIVCP